MSRPRKRGKGCEKACFAKLLSPDNQPLETGTTPILRALVVGDGEAPTPAIGPLAKL